MPITLRPISAENWRQCVRLKLAPEQQHFVAPNANSLAQAAYEPGHHPLAIYSAEAMVGFCMYWHLPGDRVYHINRLMLDAAQQRQGYGRAAMLLLIELLRAQEGCQAIDIYYEQDNHVAQAFYASLGFVETGMHDDEHELIARLRVTYAMSRKILAYISG